MSVKAQFPSEQSAAGEFQRQDDAFRGWVSADGSSGSRGAGPLSSLRVARLPVGPPHGHRAAIARARRRRRMSVVDPIRDDRGWRFGEGPGCRRSGQRLRVSERSLSAQGAGLPGAGDRPRAGLGQSDGLDPSATPTTTSCACSKSSSRPSAVNRYDLYPKLLRRRNRCALDGKIYIEVNNGVYRAGFATSQRGLRACRLSQLLYAPLDAARGTAGRAALSLRRQRTRGDGLALVRQTLDALRCPSTTATSSATCGASSDYPNL